MEQVRRVLVSAAVVLAFASTVHVQLGLARDSGGGIRLRFPEGTAHGVLELTDSAGAPLAHGELMQWPQHGAMTSRLLIRFDDGSLYDEVVRFSNHAVLRLLSYHLMQHGPSFPESVDVSFDRAGRYHVRRRSAPDQAEEEASGSTAIPDDVSNGLLSVVLKNLPPGASGTAHMLAFTPKPQLLEVHVTPRGQDQFFVGRVAQSARRFLIEPQVPGARGVLASAIGKQPPSFQMWITEEPAPALLKFEGPLYASGPTWLIGPAAPKWSGGPAPVAGAAPPYAMRK